MSKTQTVVNEVLASGILGGGVGAMLSALNSKEKFKNSTKKDEEDAATVFAAVAGVGVVLMIFLVILFILSIVFLIAIYKMMPSYKALHTIMTFFIGPIWYIPALIYYCVANDYTLVLPGMMSGMNKVAANMGAMNNRARNARYL
jgi:hypothetical protein